MGQTAGISVNKAKKLEKKKELKKEELFQGKNSHPIFLAKNRMFAQRMVEVWIEREREN